MWELVENCWKQNPKERWTVSQLRDGLRDLLDAKSQPRRTAGRVSAPPLRQSLSADACFMPSKPKEFLQPSSYSHRPTLPPSFSAPTIPSRNSDSSSHEDQKESSGHFSPPPIPPPYMDAPAFELEVTNVDAVYPITETHTASSDMLSSTTSTPERTSSLLLPMLPTPSSAQNGGIISQMLPSSMAPPASDARRHVSPALGPHPSKTLPTTFAELAQAVHIAHNIIRPLSPGSLGLFTEEEPTGPLIDLTEEESQPSNVSSSKSSPTHSRNVYPSPVPHDSPTRLATDPAVDSVAGGRPPESEFHPQRRVSNPRPHVFDSLIDIPNEPKLKSLPLSDEDIVLPFAGKEEKLHPDLAPLTWDHANVHSNPPYQSHSLSPATPYIHADDRESYFPEKPRQPVLDVPIAPVAEPERYIAELNSPPLDTPALAQSTSHPWEATSTPSSPDVASPDLDSPEELPELDEHLDVVGMKRRSLDRHGHHPMSQVVDVNPRDSPMPGR